MSLDTNIGSIRPGKFADMIAVKGDILQDITRLNISKPLLKAANFSGKTSVIFRQAVSCGNLKNRI